LKDKYLRTARGATSEAGAIQCLRNVYKNLKDHKRKHQELHASHLEELAEAIVLEQAPALVFESMSAVRAERTEKEIKEIIRREKLQRSYRKIGRTLQERQNNGLSKVDIPDKQTGGSPSLGDPQDPKTWKGPWISLTKPQEIAEVICEINARQYHQAHSTPFGSGPLADLVGRRGDTKQAHSLLQGQIPRGLPRDLMPETTRILHTLAAPSIAIASGTSSIMEEDFIQTYKRTKVSTSSSPSRRHMGHYKAVIKDPTLVRLHCAMMPMPFQQGFNAEHWTKVTDIMLEKEEGNSRCHRLRIIALFESDLNQAKRILIGRRLTHHLADTNMTPDMQFGSVPGKQCHSAVLKKVLSHDHVRLTKTTASFIENDAVGCYDRLVNNLVLMLLVKLGLPTSVASCLGTLWDEVVHHVKTIYGTSTATYGSTSEQPLYGPGQGSTCGPVFWLLCY
jgi:hypothetical protein